VPGINGSPMTRRTSRAMTPCRRPACITLVMPPIEQPRSGQPRGQRGLRNSALMSVVNDLLAKLMYRALYKMHLQAVHGSAKTMLDTSPQSSRAAPNRASNCTRESLSSHTLEPSRRAPQRHQLAVDPHAIVNGLPPRSSRPGLSREQLRTRR
jgi:hypothetical protein